MYTFYVTQLATRFKQLIPATLLASVTLSGEALARDPLQPYHVEVVVFAQQNTSGGATELLRDNLALAYPPNYRVIAPPPEKNLVAGEANLDSNVVLSDQYKTSYNPLRVLYERPEESYQLNREAAALSYKNNYRVLFHKAWQQVFSDGEMEPYIVITGGDQFDELTELAGTIKLYINKYIHLETNLWLTQFEPNFGQDSQWLRPPLAPTGMATAEQPDTGVTHSNRFERGIKTTSEAFDPLSFSSTLRQLPHADIKHSTQAYVAQQTVQLVQSRRMRSTELHYLDHPNMGLLIRIDPIDFDKAAQDSE